MPSHVLTFTYTRSGEQIAKNVTLTADGEQNASCTLTAAQVNKQLLFPISTAALKSLYINSDVACTLKTNATGTSASNTLTLAANTPLSWHDTCGITIPLSVDVGTNGIYVTNLNTSSTGTVEIRALKDATP